MKNNNITVGRILYITATVTLTISFILLVLEKSQVINLYSKPTERTAPISEINIIDYSPAEPTDNESVNTDKETGAIENQDKVINVEDPIDIVFTAAAQDEPGGPVVVRTLLNNVQSGSCKITISNGDESLFYERVINNTGTYFSCEPLDIPFADLKVGKWQLEVNVSSDNRKGYAQQEIEVKDAS